MSSEIVVPEIPNWLNDLEEKRERRLKAKLGHEAGAGAPCLKCEDKCPGLDLHFWRKACKICKCPKEEHDVHDEDIYGWAQFQLLGSKPNKIKTKIVLPGKKDEVELEWAPKGQKDTIDKYLQTLPPEALPVKGSQAAQDRKQLLQKQIPIHDIDPTLCHELNEDELKKMNDYIAHVKESSVGVGQIVNLSCIIKDNLHNLNPQEAAIIASRYAKGIPLSEIVKLQGQNTTSPLKSSNLSKDIEKLTVNDPSNKNLRNLPNFTPNSLQNPQEHTQNPLLASKTKDVNYPGYSNNFTTPLPNSQYATGFKSGQNTGHNQNPNVNIDESLLKGTNFDPKKTPSQFMPSQVPYGYNSSGLKSGQYPGQEPFENLPYTTVGSGRLAQESYTQEGINQNPNYAQNLGTNLPFGAKTQDNNQKVPNDQYGYENPLFRHKSGAPDGYNSENVPGARYGQYGGTNTALHNLADLKHNNKGLPNYAANKYNIYSDNQQQKVPRSVKDLAFSTYDPSNVNNSQYDAKSLPNLQPGQINIPEHQLEPDQVNIRAVTPNNLYYDQKMGTSYSPSKSNLQSEPTNISGSQLNQNPANMRTGSTSNQQYDPSSTQYDPKMGTSPLPNRRPLPNLQPGQINPIENNLEPNWNNLRTINSTENLPYDPRIECFPKKNLQPGQNNLLQDPMHPNQGNTMATGQKNNMQYNPIRAGNPQNQSNLQPDQNTLLQNQSPNKKPLLNWQPGQMIIPEDYLEPNQVNIGAIQDITYPEIRAATHGTNDFFEDYSPDSIREILNNIKLPDCHYCKKPFEENEFAVTIERANVLFHAQCFKCAGCNQNLADNVYFYHKESDNVYCGRDYAKIRGIPRCKACDELIFTKEYCLAENSTFHLKHFCCIECDTPLAGQDYTLEDETPYCLPCFEKSKASKCGSCERIIKPDEIGCTLNGVHFHAVEECFACKVCQKPLMGQRLLLRNEKLFCSHDCFNASKVSD